MSGLRSRLLSRWMIVLVGLLVGPSHLAHPTEASGDVLRDTLCSGAAVVSLSRDAPQEWRHIVREVLARESGVATREAGEQIFVGSADVDGDGHIEIFAYIKSAEECGTRGCPLVVLRRQPIENIQRWVIVLEAISPDAKICLSDERHTGFRDLHSSGVPGERRFVWRGDRYVEAKQE